MLDPIIVNACLTLSGALIGGLVTWHTSHDTKRIEKLQRAVDKLAPQVKAYWYLEDLYAKEKLAHISGSNLNATKGIMRDKVVKDGYERPKMTNNDVDKLLMEL